MSDTTEALIAFLNARLDEREAVAKAATAGPWEGGKRSLWIGSGEGIIVQARYFEDIAHIALNDPDRALREVEVGRAILENEIKPAIADYGEPDLAKDVRYDIAVMVLRYLVTAWSDHADFDPSWAPVKGD